MSASRLLLLLGVVVLARAESNLPPAGSELRPMIDAWNADRESLSRFYTISISSTTRERLQTFHAGSIRRLEEADFDKLSLEGQIDYLLLAGQLRYELGRLAFRSRLVEEMRPLIPFAPTIIRLAEDRQEKHWIAPEKAAATLHDLNLAIKKLQAELEAAIEKKSALPKKAVAFRAANGVEELQSTLAGWFKFYDRYDPMFTWWNATPYREVDASLKSYASLLREKLGGTKSKDEIVGDPMGREAVMAELAHEWITYTPEELIEIANRELTWCDGEMRAASREMGFGDDWRKALEKVKSDYVEPGKQPWLVNSLAREAIEFVEKHDLVTIPPVARESWRMEMMSPERQLINPFFLGGETISVSFPTQEMTQEQKLMSMRGNNRHFARATVFHELIPGHHLQGYVSDRYRPYRKAFATPFSGEGFAVYWEMLFWDLDFAKSPENRVGMLFWRMHRCARIIFSLSFHLGKMTPQECIDFLVDRVGHERENATAEVRRSFTSDYSPLYQSAYLLGGLQLRSLRREVVARGKMTDRQFHDRVLEENAIPIELLRAILTGRKLSRGMASSWRFYPLSVVTE